MGLSEWNVAALGAGVACGLFFGESVGWLQIPGDAFIGLMQMTVLPYIVLGLIGGIGKLTGDQIRLLAGRVMLIVLALWALALLAVLFVPLTLPEQTSASFFSTSTVEQPKGFDVFGLFIPANPFWSLAENKVPAVVLFCVLCGIALVKVKNRDPVLQMIEAWSEVISSVTHMVVKLSPVGVFCIAASAAGTMRLEDLERIQGYMVVMTLVAVGLALGLLPALVTAFTPFRYRDLAPVLRSATILAFATGKTLVVLPLLATGIRQMFERLDPKDEDADSTVEVLVPLGYSFPHMGRLLASAFIPFAAWYIGTPLTAEQYPKLLGASLFVHFSSAPVAVPFLLDLMHLPADLFQLFLLTGVYVGRLTDGVAASYLLTLTVLGTCAVTGRFRVQWKRLGIVAVATAVVAVLSVGAGRAYLNLTAKQQYVKDKVVASMQLLERRAEFSIVEPGPNPVPPTPGQSRLERSFARGVLRVGFVPDVLPFSYFNLDDELVGFDIDLIQRLAQELDLSIEFVPIEHREGVPSQLRDDYYDLAVGGIVDTVERSRTIHLSDPYMFVTLALVVPDHRADEFSSVKSIQSMKDLTLGLVYHDWLRERHRRAYPGIETVVLDSPREYFEQRGKGTGVDALLYAAEAGAAWTLLYPQYQVVNPSERPVEVPLIFPYADADDNRLQKIIDNWIMLKRRDGTVDALYEYWILGRGAEQQQPRWNVKRDVLGWGK